ncbi:MAG: FtsX-like permease family protein [Candidatus Binataceae bacterium]
MRYELQIALRYLRARRKDAFISVTTIFTAVGVMIGVAALVVVLSVMGGFESNLRQRILSLTPQVQIQNTLSGIAHYDKVQAIADRVPGVAGSDPYIIGQGMISSAHGISGVVVRGVEPRNAVVIARLHRYIQRGSLRSLAHPPAIVPEAKSSITVNGEIAIGSTLAETLGAKVGDEVNLVAPITVKNSELSTKTGHFLVGAVFESGIAYIDRDLVFMDLDTAQRFFGRAGKADGIEIQLINLNDTRRVTAALQSLFSSPYRVSNWMEFNQAAAAGFAMLKRVYAIVLVILIGVAAFNLVATLIMVVMEKRKDIAVLMAMGAKRNDVRRIFILKGLIVGAAGTLAGLLLAAVACFALAHYHFIHIPKKIYGISTLPVAAEPINFVAVAICSMVLCLVATFYPARQAARELPVEVFRS